MQEVVDSKIIPVELDEKGLKKGITDTDQLHQSIPLLIWHRHRCRYVQTLHTVHNQVEGYELLLHAIPVGLSRVDGVQSDITVVSEHH